MRMADLPADVRAVLREFYTCEATTVNRQGEPLSWPTVNYFDEAAGEIILAASIAFPVKALNARRNPHVSLLYSDPTGSGLAQPPAVLVQGEATVAEISDYFDPKVRGLFRGTVRHQPDMRRFISNRVSRRLFTWYLFQRLLITVRPRRLLVWPAGDFSAVPTEIEVSDVE